MASKRINAELQPQDNAQAKQYVHVKWKVLFFIIVITVQTALLLKLPLYIIRQIMPRILLPQLCAEKNTSQASNGKDYIFTLVVYSLTFIGRFMEALIVHIHIYKFVFQSSLAEVCQFKKFCIAGLTKKKWITVGFIILSLYMLAHSLSIPALGIALEDKHGKDSNCSRYVHEYYTVYWILDVIRYLYDVGIRLFMLLATMAIGRIWAQDAYALGKTPTENEKEPENYTEYLQDREITNKDHQARTIEYTQRGRQVEPVLEIFQTWFMLPWVIYIVASSVNTDHILRAWKNGSNDEGQYDFSEITFMVYNFNQLFLLTLPYLCSKKMNTHHHNYFSGSRKQQIEMHKTASRMAFASMNKIEKEDHYNFIPRIWGTSIKLQVENPLYIMFLLVGIFFTVCEALI